MTTASPPAAQNRDPYAAQGAPPADDKAVRVKRLAAEDPQFRDAFPLAAVSEAKRQPGLRLAEIVKIVMEGYADRPALGRRAYELATDSAGRSTVRLLPRFDTITYRELWARARGVAGEWCANSQHPLKAGDFACILGFASPDYATLILASIHLGAVIVPLQTSAPPSQHRDIIAETEPRILATGIDYLPNAVEAVLTGYAPQRLVVFDYEPRDDVQREKLEAARKRLADAGRPIVVDTLEALADRGGSLPPAPLYLPPAEEDPLAWLFYTSGSTGTPKGAMFTQSLVSGTWLGEPGIPVITLSFMPMSHLPRRTSKRRSVSAPSASPWWAPDRHRDRRPFLTARTAITRAVRAWFEAEGFIEVETAALQVSPGNEAHLHAFESEAIGPGGERAPLYLRTSPEFAAKKLLAAGEPKIFELAKVWRNRERGPLHHPEFTMLEWYRAGVPYEQLMADCADLLRLAAERAGAKRFEFRGREVDPFAEPERVTLAEAFAVHAGIDLLATVDVAGETDREALAAAARAAGIRVAADDTWADVFSRVLVERIEPKLGEGRATILCEYPTAEAALARPKPADPRVAERFELYACGVELANCFGELTDPAEQRRRFEAEMAEKARVYGERYPIDEDFLAALGQMPPASGAALGFDRLVMLAAGARHIEQVMWAPVAG